MLWVKNEYEVIIFYMELKRGNWMMFNVGLGKIIKIGGVEEGI